MYALFNVSKIFFLNLQKSERILENFRNMDALVFTEWMEKLTEELGKKLEEVCKKNISTNKKSLIQIHFLSTGAWQCRHS